MTLPAWDITTDKDNPQPAIWPECPTCFAPYAYRRFLSMRTGGYVWAWARDCKHKSTAVIMTADGPYAATIKQTGEVG